MASTLVNLVKIAAASTGSGAIRLGTPAEGYRGIEALTNGDVYSYSIQRQSVWEFGRGTFLSSGPEMTRTPIASSDGGTAVNVQIGDMIAFVALADDFASTADMEAANAAAAAASAAGAAASDAATEAVLAAQTAAAAVTALSASDGAAQVGSADGTTVQGALNARPLPVATRAALATLTGMTAGRKASLYEGLPALDGRMGGFTWNAGDLSAEVTADPQQGIYVPPASDTTGASGCWVRDWDDVNGRPEWFGAAVNSTGAAADNVTALHACRDLCPATILGPFTYYTSDTVQWNVGDRKLLGCAQNYGGVLASAITITGSNAATNTVFQFGGDDDAHIVRGLHCADIAFKRSGTANGSVTGDAEDCVKGVLYRYATNSTMERCRVFGSPIGFHITLSATTQLYDCNVAPAASAANDISVAFLIGGYTTYPGFIGNNGSLRLEGNTAFGFPASTYTAHTLLFGLPADTWMDRCEGSTGKNGIDVCGMNKTSMIDYLAGGTAARVLMDDAESQQDIRISQTRMDTFSGIGFYIHDMNISADVAVNAPYASTCPSAFSVNNVQGRVGLLDPQFYAPANGYGGIDVNAVNMFSARGGYLRNFAVPVQLAAVFGLVLDVDIFNTQFHAAAAVKCLNVVRSTLKAVIRGAPDMFGAGFTLDADCGFNAVDASAVDPGAFDTVDAQYKVRFDGADASAGTGKTAFEAAGNVLIGVTT